MTLISVFIVTFFIADGSKNTLVGTDPKKQNKVIGKISYYASNFCFESILYCYNNDQGNLLIVCLCVVIITNPKVCWGCYVVSLDLCVFLSVFLSWLSDFLQTRPHISISFCRHLECCQVGIEFAFQHSLYRNATDFRTSGNIMER
jgi:hypothetical protein